MAGTKTDDSGNFRSSVIKLVPMWFAICVCSAPFAVSILFASLNKSDFELTSGSHPLHQYHAWIGAKGLLKKGCPSAFDPAFHAGYLKTPLFDNQSHPIEWMSAIKSLIVCPDEPPILSDVAKVYAWYLGGIVFGVPFLVAIGARFAGLNKLETFISAVCSVIVMAMPAGNRAINDGEMGQLLAPSCIVMFTGALVGYHLRALPACGVAICFSYWMLWSTSVGSALLATAILLYFYLRAGLRHESWWHFGLVSSLVLALAGNLDLFLAWRNHWWIQATNLDENALGSGTAFMRLAGDTRWGGASGFSAGLLMFVAGIVGDQCLIWTGRRLAGRLIATATVILTVMFALAKSVNFLAQLDIVANPVSIMLISCIGVGSCLGVGFRDIRRWSGPKWFLEFPGRHVPSTIFFGVLLSIFLLNPSFVRNLSLNCLGSTWRFDGPPLWAKTITEKLAEYPAGKGRVLWEDLTSDISNGWPVLLPQKLDRGLIGGLSPFVRIEHQQAALREGKLAGRTVLEWTDSELAAFVKAYRINIVVARNKDSISRWTSYFEATLASQGTIEETQGKWVIFSLPDQTGLAIVGNAKVVQMGSDKVTLADVVPENGSVVLSLHYQRGMKVRPGRVKVERELDSHDPIPLIRLKSDEPVSRLELEWDDH